MILALAGQLKQLPHTCAWKFSVIEVSRSFLEFMVNIIIIIVISKFNLFVTLWIIKEFENVWNWQCHNCRGRSFKYHCRYKYYVRKWNASFPALVNWQMEFSVIGAFILIMEERFPLSWCHKFYKHNSTTSSSLNQFNKGFVSLNLWDRQVAPLCVRFVLIHVVDILIAFLFVCLFVCWGKCWRILRVTSPNEWNIFQCEKRKVSNQSCNVVFVTPMPNHFTWIYFWRFWRDYSDRGAIYYVTVVTVISSRVKTTCYWKARNCS